MISRGISTAATGLLAAVLLAQSVPVSAAQPTARAGHVIHRAAMAPQAFMPSSRPSQPSSQAPSPRVPPTLGGAWSSLGPTTISPENSTGRALALIVNGANLFIGGADGGIWMTTTASLASTPVWTALTDVAADSNLAIQSFANDPTLNSRIYAGTGELATSIDSRYGQGVYVSTNSGSTWTLQNPGGIFTNLSVSALVVDSAGNVYAAAAEHLVPATSGLYKSTDHGVNWSLVPSLLTNHDVTDLAIGSDDTIYAAVGDPGGTAATNGIWKSVGGAAFTNTTALSPGLAGTYRWRLAMPSQRPTASQVLWAVAGNNLSGDIQAVIQTANGGGSWTSASGNIAALDGPPCGNHPCNPVNQAWYDLEILADPLNAGVVYVGTHDIYKTANGGGSWTNITNVYGGPNGTATPANIHPDQHALIFSGTDLIAGNDGGAYRSTNAGTSWAPRNGNLNLAQFYGGAVAGNPNQLLGGLQDNGSIYTPTAGPSWTDESGGDGFFTAIDPNNSNFMYAEYPDGNLLVSSTGPVGLGTATSFTPNNTSEPAEFSADLVLDPNNPATIYSARASLWWNTNHGSGAWTSSSPTGLAPPGNCFSPGCIHRIAVAPGNPLELFVVSGGGNVNGDHTYRTVNGPNGPWPPADGTAGCVAATNLSPHSCAQLNHGNITDVAIDGQNNQVVYETVDGFSAVAGHHVFKSADLGATWADVSASLPNVPFETVVVSGGAVYAGSDNGVFASLDGGSSWNRLGTNLPNARVFFLVVQSSTVFAFTHGRGAWQIAAPSQPGSRTPVLPAPPTGTPARDPVKASLPTPAPTRTPINPGTTSRSLATPAPTTSAGPEPSPSVEPVRASRSWSDLQLRRQRWAF